MLCLIEIEFFIQYKHISVLYISFRTSCYIYFYIISVSHEFIEYVFNNRSLYICIYIYISYFVSSYTAIDH